MKLLCEGWREFLKEGESVPKGAAVVIFDPEGQVLLLLRPDNVNWAPGKWALPGGHIEEGEKPIDAAVREVREETTLVIADPTEFYMSSNGEVVYFATRDYTGEVAVDFEHEDFAWAYPDDLTNYDIAPSVQDVVGRAKEALSYA